MKTRFWRMSLCVLASAVVAGSVGCMANQRPALAGRSAGECEKLVKPGKFKADFSGPADGRRDLFDIYNEQVVREDVKVSTVFMGDSITQLWELNAYFIPAGGVIINRGISGDLALYMAKRFEADVLQLRPRNVVILAGTNDVARFVNQRKSDEEIIRSVTDSLAAMIKDARQAGLHTMVCAIIPTHDTNGMHEAKKRILPKINDNVKALCAEHGAIYVDYAAGMSDGEGNLRKELSRDGLHPHWAGYDIMADLIIDAARAHGLEL